MNTVEDVLARIIPRRPIEGISAALLTFDVDGRIDFDSDTRHLAATATIGLIPFRPLFQASP